MKIIGLFILTILFISACHKDDPIPSDKVPYGDGSRTKVEGRVFEYGSNKPLVNCMVVLQEEFHEPFSGGGVYNSIDTTYSDSVGYYFFDFIHTKNDQVYSYSYAVEAFQALYFSSGRSFEQGYWNKNRDIILDPYAWIRVHFKNVNPFDDDDYCSVSTGGGGSPVIGKHVDTTQTRITFGNRVTYVTINLRRNKIISSKKDSIYIYAHDTALYEVLY